MKNDNDKAMSRSVQAITGQMEVIRGKRKEVPEVMTTFIAQREAQMAKDQSIRLLRASVRNLLTGE